MKIEKKKYEKEVLAKFDHEQNVYDQKVIEMLNHTKETEEKLLKKRKRPDSNNEDGKNENDTIKD